MLKRIALIIIALTILVFGAGCSMVMPERLELDKLFLIRVVGVDKGIENPDSFRVTVLGKDQRAKSSQAQQEGGAQSDENIVLSDEGLTFFEAGRKFQTYTDKRVFWRHADYLLIGEDATKEEIVKWIDIFCRDSEIRSASHVFIVQGSTAREFIEQSSKSSSETSFLPDRLRAISQNSKFITGPQSMELIELMYWLNEPYSCPVLPVIRLSQIEKESKQQEGQQQGGQQQGGQQQGGQQPSIMDLDLGGYAVFKDLKLAHIIDKDLVRGTNFLLNKVSLGTVSVQDPEGGTVGLEITSSDTKIDPVVKDGQLLEMKVEVHFSSNIIEIHSPHLYLNKATLKFLEEGQANIIKDEIERVIQTAKQHNTDFIDMANTFSTKHPMLWEKHKEKWEEIFPALPISVEVESKINRTYDVRNGIIRREHN